MHHKYRQSAAMHTGTEGGEGALMLGSESGWVRSAHVCALVDPGLLILVFPAPTIIPASF
jgi:hypothetical protein